MPQLRGMTKFALRSDIAPQRKIYFKMSDTKIFSLGDSGIGGGSMAPLIASLCQNRGLDPNMVAAMMNNRGSGYGDGFGNSAWWIIILLIFGWGGFGNGFGGGFGGRGSAQGLADLGNLVNNDAGRELLMSAIQGNGTAISQLASTVHCDQNALMGAIQNLSTQLCSIGNQVGMSGQQIINAIQAGNSALASQLASCCCDIRNAITTQGFENQLATVNQTNTLQGAINFVNSSVERGFAATNFETQRQTCDILGAIDKQTQAMVAQFAAIKEREDQREIQNLRDQVQAYQLSASQQQQTANIVGQLQPVPRPSYIVPNPYGCGCNNYGYPFANNGCNNGCGC